MSFASGISVIDLAELDPTIGPDAAGKKKREMYAVAHQSLPLAIARIAIPTPARQPGGDHWPVPAGFGEDVRPAPDGGITPASAALLTAATVNASIRQKPATGK